MEPKARARYELFVGVEMEPVTLEHPEYPQFRASLDGYNAESGVVLEIKCPGKDDHAKAKAGEIPEKYVWQLEHQLWVSGAEKAHYFSYSEKGDQCDHALVEYVSNPERRDRMISALHEFWACVTEDRPPALSQKDAMEVKDAQENQSLFSRLLGAERSRLEAKKRLAAIEAELDGLKPEIARVMPHDRVRFEDGEIVRKGDSVQVKFKK